MVLDKATRTRALVEASGSFVVQLPTVRQLRLTNLVGNRSLNDDPHKLAGAGVGLMRMEGVAAPLVEGCSAWLACRLVPEPHNQQAYDLFIGEVTAAWADTRAFRDGHWQFETADPGWRSLHHIAGGHFYAIGEALRADDRSPRKTCCALHWQSAMLAVRLVQLRFSTAIAAARDGFSRCPTEARQAALGLRRAARVAPTYSVSQ